MLVAGVDVGNATTEVALARLVPGQPPEHLSVTRGPTTGAKGTAESAQGVLDLIDPSYTYPLSPPGRREEAEAAGYIMATRHWGITYDAIRDLRQDIWRRSEAGIIYRDICIDISLVYQRNETNPLGPSSTDFTCAGMSSGPSQE